MAGVTLAERLTTYGLAERAGNLANLRVGSNDHQIVTKDSLEYGAHVVALQPKTLQDLRTFLGAGISMAGSVARPRGGGEAAAQKGSRAAPGRAAAGAEASRPLYTAEIVRPVRISNISVIASGEPTPFDPVRNADMYTLTRQILADPSAPVDSTIETAVSQWLAFINPTIWAALFYDIYVSAASTLEFGTDISALFAHYVTVEETGQIILQSGVFKLDIAGFKGGVQPTGDGTGTTGTAGTTAS